MGRGRDRAGRRGHRRSSRRAARGPGRRGPLGRAYIAQGHPDTFNLYDTGAVAEGELLQAMQPADLVVEPDRPGTLLDDLAAQLRAGEEPG